MLSGKRTTKAASTMQGENSGDKDTKTAAVTVELSIRSGEIVPYDEHNQN